MSIEFVVTNPEVLSRALLSAAAVAGCIVLWACIRVGCNRLMGYRDIALEDYAIGANSALCVVLVLIAVGVQFLANGGLT